MERISEKHRLILLEAGIKELRPAQSKSLNQGLLEGKNQLICTPTASGKTLIAEMAAMHNLHKGKTVYIVPLIALANEKYKTLKERYKEHVKVALSVGDKDRQEPYLIDYDIIVCTAEKLDSLIRHQATWLALIKTVIVDEIHLLNDVSRGPTLEILITILKKLVPKAQIIGLSATIGNPQQLADWLEAELIIDTWRPVPLKKGTLLGTDLQFENERSDI